jgi:S1-C subfamily serine protease
MRNPVRTNCRLFRLILVCELCIFSVVVTPTKGQVAGPNAASTPGGLTLQLPLPAPNPQPAGSTNEPKATPSSAVENSVVKVFSSMRAPDLYKPWAKQAASEVTGSGVVIEGKRILTNAHVVIFSSEVQIQANQAGDKVSASVETIAPGMDLAVLKLDDEKFFDTHPPLPRGEELPDIKDAVLVYGYPTGGTNLSITKGIISRIEFTGYNFPDSGLRIQLDAAINPGNSGGPAVVEDKMIGLAFSHLGGAENIGYVIPCEEIDLFLRSIVAGKYKNKPGFYEEWPTLENPALRPFLKLGQDVEGVVVRTPFHEDASYPLKKWDVITKIGDSPINDQGMVKIGANLRVFFPYMVQHVTKDGKIPLSVVRSGKQQHVDLPAFSDYPVIIPEWRTDYPPYFILGPVVFCEARAEIIGSLLTVPKGTDWMTHLISLGNPLIRDFGAREAFPGQRLVYISSPFFPHKLSKGYSNPVLRVVQSINNRPVKNLTNLVETIRDSKDEFLTIDFGGRYSETLVFSRKEMMEATESILTDNGIRSQGSPEVMSVWSAAHGQK